MEIKNTAKERRFVIFETQKCERKNPYLIFLVSGSIETAVKERLLIPILNTTVFKDCKNASLNCLRKLSFILKLINFFI